VFVGFTAEELVGPQFCVYQMGKEGAMKVSAMLNLDSLDTSVDQAGIGPR
jgi:hypothetical protein